MVRVTLADSDNLRREVDVGESADIVATFYDMDGDALAKAAIATLTATLVYVDSSEVVTVINSRNAQSILDANGGLVASSGVLTFRLQALDNIIVDTTLTESEVESHYLTLVWTWSDGTLTRTGKQEFEILVRNIAAP